MAINRHLKEVINKILTKKLTPVNIYRINKPYFSIDIISTNPTELISIIYPTELKRDEDFKYLDNKVFWSLPFNPYNNLD